MTFEPSHTIADDAILHPDWDVERNVGLHPADLGSRTSTPVWWRCAACATEARESPLHRARRGGCGTCRPPRGRAPVPLAEHLVGEWHPHRNDDLGPSQLSAGSRTRVWWRCSTCGHDWQARVGHRTTGSGCPLCGRRRPGRALTVAEAGGALHQEWHPTRNGDLDPTTVTIGSHARVWSRCSTCGHEWTSTVANRARGSGCPICRRRWALAGQLLVDLAPDLLADWHPTRNGAVDPLTVAAGSQLLAWWRCAAGHEWAATVVRRARLGHGCQRCAARRTASART